MSHKIPAELHLPPVDQIGFVVRDMEKALALYTPVFGDFVVMDAADLEWEYRGSPEVSSLKVAFARSGDVEIELIEWVSGKTPHKEFLDAGHEGMHHLRFVVQDIVEKVKQAEAHGYRQIWYKRFGEGLATSYLERDGDPLILEFFENKALNS
ncbi:VOC family protein [Pseudohalioglobus lutimaris]|nr:VOC family protein [Pseudohalioglobus lutimaris]